MLEQILLTFLERAYPNGHCFMADNNPKHTSKASKDFLKEKGISWWRNPAESPDCNPIESLWHELKEYNRCIIKPTTNPQLIDGIKQFWETVTATSILTTLRRFYLKLLN